MIEGKRGGEFAAEGTGERDAGRLVSQLLLQMGDRFAIVLSRSGA